MASKAGDAAILSNLNPAQQEAVTFWGRPLLILAGAGSGKTKTLTTRAAWLISEKGIPPQSILLLTFTNKAAGEMKDRIAKLMDPKDAYPPFAGTFHSFCAKVLRRDGKFIGLSSNFAIYDTSDQQDIVKTIIANLGLDKSLKAPVALSMISQCKNELVSALEYAEFTRGEFQKKIAKVYLEYQRLLKESSALDFDDLLTETVKLFKTEKDVLNKYRNLFQHILVDEWQDTNKAQYQIIKLLTGRDHNLTVVGDAAQSIYKWRGADYRNINYLQVDFPDLKTINLEQNYRSTQTILDAAHGVIKKNRSHPILQLWTNNKKGEKIKLYQARSELDEASFVTEEIVKLTSKNKQSKEYSDIAVLYRTNAQSRVIEEAFLHRGIPYTLVGGVKFYERKEIKDILAYLRLVANPKDSVSNKRAEKLGKTRFANFCQLAEKIMSDEGRVLMDKKELTTLDLLDKVVQTTKYLEFFDQKNEDDLARLENIKELRSVATEFPNLFEFLEQVALVEAAQSPKNSESSNNGKVTLMTAHSAKGLEFEVVFIVGLEEGLLPHSRSLMNQEELEEERRLVYVGITRAKCLLYLSYAQKRLIFGQRGSSMPSRFLGEIPNHLLESSALVGIKKNNYELYDIDF
ncbi:MAG: hypothetical protein A2694_00375 [Candidatus Blackburnbacteria bacterium RIFCSPHIGHO2_01_FULL_40_17]|nr:MAG: hypothetical protein A2694_00375 [Candidatus Blackburnbacteria bacterium RIFCSPHIGHO2_01_FULL_40_17]